tara:strand:- start:728 stop:1075 length:348 start_codon:yes stop_codon:yes gene_type:complete
LQTISLLRENQITFEEVYTLFVNASKQHWVSFTEKNMTKQYLRHFSGLIIVENKTIHRMAILSDYFQEQHRMMAKRINEEQTPYQYWEDNQSSTRKQIQRNVKNVQHFAQLLYQV